MNSTITKVVGNVAGTFLCSFRMFLGETVMANKNLMVKALAGTGKTSTMVWSVGSVPAGVKLSEEQEAIRAWFLGQKIDRFRFLAFNKSIADELSKKVPGYCEAATCHSSGLSIIKAGSGKIYRKVDSWKYRKIMDTLFGEPKKAEDYQLRNAANQVIDLARVHLLGAMESVKDADVLQLGPGDIEAIELNHDIDAGTTNGQLLEIVNGALAVGTQFTCREIDFTDMIWFPVFHKMKTSKIGGLVVDECQDLNRAQQELVMMQGHQIICVGDVNQAIYGFAGADAISMDRLEKTLDDQGGVDVLPLTMTRRCGKKIVELARTIVPGYKAADTNPEGTIRDSVKTDTVLEELQQLVKGKLKSTMALCRTNAPLVSLAFRLLRKEVPVFIRGKDIGDNLIKLVNKVANKSDDIDVMISGLTDYASQEEAKIRKRFKYGAEDKIVALEDKVDCIRVLASDCNSVVDLTNKLARLFQDKDSSNSTVLLSSVHKAKGLEADNVYIYKPELLPHPKLLEKSNGKQEYNLQYVGYTRAIHELVFIDSNK